MCVCRMPVQNLGKLYTPHLPIQNTHKMNNCLDKSSQTIYRNKNKKRNFLVAQNIHEFAKLVLYVVRILDEI